MKIKVIVPADTTAKRAVVAKETNKKNVRVVPNPNDTRVVRTL